MYPFIEKIIEDHVADRNVSFVFPSEVAADSWSRRSLDISGARGVLLDRFLGWDTFKERLLSPRREEHPADRRVRVLWAASALAENARSCFLQALIRPEHRGSFQGYVPFLAGMLPKLKRTAERASALPGDAKVRDLKLLYERYRAFLKERNLFEPSFEELPAPESEGVYILLSPELAEDYEEYQHALASYPSVRIIPLPSQAAPQDLFEFPNLYEELRWTFLSVARDLDKGLRPEEIAVTITNLDRAEPWVEKAASLAGVPIEIRSGPPLARLPVGRFLSALGTCSARRFDLESVSALLLDRFLPWKDPQAVRGLVRFGMDRHAYAPYHAGGRPVDTWIESFRVCEGTGTGLESVYRRLKAGVEEVTGAADFRALARSFVAFRRSFLDESRFSEEDERSFQRAMVELEAFAREEQELGLSGFGGSVFPLFLDALESIRYVPQSTGPAVSVYAYRVSALTAFERHYVAGSSQEGMRVSVGDAPGLREDQKEALGCPDRDVSALYARAYAASGSTIFTYSVESLEGWSLPYPGLSLDGAAGPPGDYERTRALDPWPREARAWAGGAFPEAILEEQAEAARASAYSLRKSASNYERDLASPEAREPVLARIRDGRGRLRLSATHVEELRACPFAWLLARGLALREELSGVGFFDARLAGQMAHDAVRILYQRIQAGGAFRAADVPRYRPWAADAVAATLPGFEKEHGPFLRPMFEAYVPKLEDRVQRLLEEEAASFDGWEIGQLETDMGKDYPELEVALIGRPDRVARRGDEYAVIDYKKRSLPRGTEIFPDEDGNLAATQMAAYTILCEAAGKRITRARYWSLEDAAALDAIGPGGRSRADYEPALRVFEGYLEDAARRLRAGDFRMPRPEEHRCEGCGWQAVCRVRYATE